MRRLIYILIGVIMIMGLGGCGTDKDGSVAGKGSDIQQIPTKELEQQINPDNMIFEYYEAVVATQGGDTYDEYVLYRRDEEEGLILAQYTKWEEGDEKCLCCIVPEEIFDKCMKMVKKYKMQKWDDGYGMTGKRYVVRFPGSDGEMMGVSSEDMPEDGEKSFNAVRGVILEAWGEYKMFEPASAD